MLKISVIVPAYNEEKMLPQCLASLKAQDYSGQYEIIVVNHDSTDGTERVAREYGMRILLCKDRSGTVGAISPRDVGAQAATGDIIVQADADTIYPVEWLTRIARVFTERPEVVGLTGRFIYKTPPSWARLEYYVRDRVNQITQTVFGHPIIISGATFAFRREAFLKIGGYDKGSYSPDQYNIATRLRQQGKVAYDSAVVVKTSHRAVQKPFPVIVGDVAVHLWRFSSDFFKSSLGFGKGLSAEARPRRRRLVLRTGVAAVLVSLLAFTLYGYIAPTSSAFGKVYVRGDTTQKVIALTFDDGPNEPYTTQILDILDAYDIKATFFMVGQNVEQYPATARRVVATGHVLGNHSYIHDANHALSTQGPEDIRMAQQAIGSVTGVSPHFYRPPHGKKSPWELYFVKQDNMVEVTWNISVSELSGDSADTIARKIASQAKPGAIILLHDGYGTDHNIPQADKSLTVAALPLIIDSLHEQGYTFLTVADLLDMPAYN